MLGPDPLAFDKATNPATQGPFEPAPGPESPFRSSTWRWVRLGIRVAAALVTVGVFYFTDVGRYLSDVLHNGGQLPRAEVDTTPLGDGFTHGDVSAAEGWRLGTDSRGRPEIEGVRLTNDGDDAQRLGVLLFLYDGNESVGTSNCRTDEPVEPGETAAAVCRGQVLGDPDGVTLADPLDF